MDYYQSVVAEFLRADRSMFPECLIQLDNTPGNIMIVTSRVVAP